MVGSPVTTTGSRVTTTGSPATTMGSPVTTTGSRVMTTGSRATTMGSPVTTTGSDDDAQRAYFGESVSARTCPCERNAPPACGIGYSKCLRC